MFKALFYDKIATRQLKRSVLYCVKTTHIRYLSFIERLELENLGHLVALQRDLQLRQLSNIPGEEKRPVQGAVGRARGSAVVHLHVVGAPAQHHQEQDDNPVVSSFETPPSRPVRQALRPLGLAQQPVQLRLNAPHRGRQARPRERAQKVSAAIGWRRAHHRPDRADVVSQPSCPLGAGDRNGEGFQQRRQLCIRHNVCFLCSDKAAACVATCALMASPAATSASGFSAAADACGCPARVACG